MMLLTFGAPGNTEMESKRQKRQKIWRKGRVSGDYGRQRMNGIDGGEDSKGGVG